MTRFPGSVPGTWFAGPHSLWPPPFAPPVPRPVCPALFTSFAATMAESDFPRPYVIGYGSSPSRCRPARLVATGQTWDLPVPAQRASTHARFFDHAGPSGRSRSRARPCRLPLSQRRRHPGYESLRGSMAGLCAPLPTLRCRPHGQPRTARGRCGSLLRHRVGLAPTTRCRSPGALRKILYVIRYPLSVGGLAETRDNNEHGYKFGSDLWFFCQHG